ncbi:hypothetical protein J2Y38_002037 [Flavobacterium sp. 2755]|uniref:hypothetical protein n=1 Tax=Flavobacterium sp. 2755 TaxID=2817765 RepID=UPI00286550A4|nr:hypothetical protein [Flavobacterium sp. 2755]MDR6761828.1 hypothetical protein [Flavobacterium sp. 2755]
MNTIRPKQDFETILENVLSSKILTNSNQKALLLILLCNHKKYNMRHYSFTLSEELCRVLNVSNPTFRKERDKLESLNLIFVKAMIDNKMVVAERAQRKHTNLYYYFNWQRLQELNFIKLTKGFGDVFNIGQVTNFDNMKKLNDEVDYNYVCYRLNDLSNRIGNGTKMVLKGKELKAKLKLTNNNFKYHNTPPEAEYVYFGVYKVGQNFL